MDQPGPTAPPVVAVVVVHEPGPWFVRVLDGLAEQDYLNLNSLFLITSEPGDLPTRIKDRLPRAFIRAVPSNPGFGLAANEALRLVEGNGFFCFMHDDVELEPSAISTLMEELYRSNAGIVGPKLVEWDEPSRLQHVGLAVDRFAETDPLIEPGEIDQEQHDAVRDVFAVPSACLLVRADLFRTLGGFQRGYDFHGEDVDLCWRAHLSGARVLVVPEARARHLEALSERRPDLAHRAISARHNVDTMAALTHRARLPLVLVERLVLAIVETIVGLFTRTVRSGLATLAATLTVPLRLPEILRRRRAVRPLRAVPASEVVGLQLRGSARLNRYLRRRHLRHAGGRTVRDTPRLTVGGPLALWTVLLALFAIGSRAFISNAVPRIGQFVDLPTGRSLWSSYLAGSSSQGFGTGSTVPSAFAVLGTLLRVVGSGGWVRLVLVLGLVVGGYLGAWRMVAFFPSSRARMAGLLVYAAVPLPYAAIAAGRWGVLAVYAATPWAIELLRANAGLRVLGAGWGDDDIADIVTAVSPAQRIRSVAALSLLVGLVAAFVPVFPLVIVLAALCLLIGTLVARGALTILAAVAAAIAAAVVAAVLNLPWSASLLRSGGWADLVGARHDGSRGLGLLKLAAFQIGPAAIAPLALAVYVPILVAPLIARGWRLTWTARAAALVFGPGALVVLDDRGLLPLRMPEPGVLLVPVACGVAIAAACAVAGYDHDIRGARFGWRQPLGLVVGLALLVAVVPGIGAVISGRWSAPRLAFATYLRQLPDVDPLDPNARGDYRVLYLGRPDLLPVPGRSLEPGVSWAVTSHRFPTLDDQWLGTTGEGERLTLDALGALASQSTTHVGRLLGPLGIRYIVVPTGAGDDLATARVPAGLTEALSSQLDLRQLDSPNALVIYENTTALPVRSMLDAVAAASSGEGGQAARAAAPLGAGEPVLVGLDPPKVARGALPAGTLNVAAPDDGRWSLTVGGQQVASRPSFGWSLAFDLPAGGDAVLERRSDGARRMWIALQALAWLLTAAVAVFAGQVRGMRMPGAGAEGAFDPGDDAPIQLGTEEDAAADDLWAPTGPLGATDRRPPTVDGDEDLWPAPDDGADPADARRPLADDPFEAEATDGLGSFADRPLDEEPHDG